MIIGGLTGLHLGSTFAFSAILLPQLPDTLFTLSEKSWIASISNLGLLVSALISGLVSYKIGRNYSIILFNISLMAGWLIIIIYHENIVLVMLGRVLQGFGVLPSVGKFIFPRYWPRPFKNYLSLAPAQNLVMPRSCGFKHYLWGMYFFFQYFSINYV